MINAEIQAQGETIEDIEMAFDEALRRIKAGFTSGMDENETGGFQFTVDEE